MSSRSERFNFFSYQWSYSDEETTQGLQCVIRGFGWNEKNESVYMQVQDFLLPLYIELPDWIEWNDSRIRMVCNRLQTMNSNVRYRPKTICFEEKQRLYYAHVEKSLTKRDDGIKYTNKKFPYLLALFSSCKAFESFTCTLRAEVSVTGLGKIRLKCHAAMNKINPVLRFIAVKKIPSAGWMRARGVKVLKVEQESTRQHEYCVSYQNVEPMSDEDSIKMPIVLPKIMSFDNEANSTILSSMPKANRPGDKTFQIGYTMLDPAKNGKPKQYRKYLISMGNPDPIEGVTIIKARTEADLYVTFTEKMREEDPEVILGFNILGWDVNYMIDRSKNMCSCMGEFDMMGCIPGKHGVETPIKWQSSACGKQEFNFINADGRLFIDMLPYMQRSYKLPNYRLETICDEFLKTNKDPVKPKDIFRAYRSMVSAQTKPENKELQTVAGKELATIGKYCCQDSFVCLLLFEKVLTWYDLVEAATTNHVPIFAMYTEGQQIKMAAQVYAYCFHNDIVMESDVYQAKEEEHYTGAYVSEPIKGLYDSIIPFDFCSLYPSIMMAYNIDYSKLVNDPKIPDSDCYVMEWEEHEYCSSKGCPKDIHPKGAKPPKLKDGKHKFTCAVYKYRWLKYEVSGKGVLPTLLEHVLGARKRTKKIMESYVGELKDLKKKYEETNKSDDKLRDKIEHTETLIIVLDKRQNAYKINANSMYGATGVKQGYLPFLPAAMCVTFMGRVNIFKVNKYIEEHCEGRVIYNDTDSAYCHFPKFKDRLASELWAHAEKIVQDIKSLFPPPISLEFEQKIYKVFLILTKKRYAAQSINKDGIFDMDMNKVIKLLKRGIILQRRDNCKVLRETYQNLMNMIFSNHDELVKLKNDIIQRRSERSAELKLLQPQIDVLRTTLQKEFTSIDKEGFIESKTKRLYKKAKDENKINETEIIKDITAKQLIDKRLIYNNPLIQELLYIIIQAIDSLFRWKYGYKDFVITKQITKDFTEYKNQAKLPGHVLLGMKMHRRGVPIGGGSRVEYLIVNNKAFKKTDSQKEKIEDVSYFATFREIFRISYLDYLKQFINPLDELCTVVMGIDGFVKEQFEQRIKFNRLIDCLNDLFATKITFGDVGPMNKFMKFED